MEPTICTSCHTGYRLKDTRCIGRFTMGFVFELDTDYNTFLTSGLHQPFLLWLSILFGVDIQDIIITQLREGSVEIGGSASATS